MLGEKDNLRGTSRPMVGYLQLAGLISKSHYGDQSHTKVHVLCPGVTILKSSTMSSVSASSESRRSLRKKRNKSGPVMKPCGTPLRNGMIPENSSSKCFVEAHPERCAAIHLATASPRPKDFVFAKEICG